MRCRQWHRLAAQARQRRANCSPAPPMRFALAPGARAPICAWGATRNTSTMAFTYRCTRRVPNLPAGAATTMRARAARRSTGSTMLATVFDTAFVVPGTTDLASAREALLRLVPGIGRCGGLGALALPPLMRLFTCWCAARPARPHAGECPAGRRRRRTVRRRRLRHPVSRQPPQRTRCCAGISRAPATALRRGGADRGGSRARGVRYSMPSMACDRCVRPRAEQRVVPDEQHN